MLELQVKLLKDGARNDALYRALKLAVLAHESVVVDIGSGTGFLSFLSVKLGARACHGYETDPDMFDMSRKLAQENKMSRCTFYNMHSVEVKNPPKADVVISETLGNFALEENILETLRDAKRFLKPNGIMIPCALTQYVAPVTSLEAYDKVNVWDNVGFGLHMRGAKEEAFTNMYVQTFKKEDLIAQHDAVQTWDTIDFTKEKEPSIRKKSAEWKMEKPQTIYGFAMWWDAMLVPGISLRTSPFDAPTHWEQIFLPLVDPLTVPAGKTLNLKILSDSRWEVGIHVEWKAEIKK